VAATVVGDRDRVMQVSVPEHIVVHDSPVWRDRARAVLRAVVPNPPDGEEWFEQLWAAPVSAGRYELCCIPFATYDYALGDVVEVGSGEMEYTISRVAQPSGRVVLRVWLAGSDREAWDELQGLIRFRGLLFEFRKPALVALDVVDEVMAAEVEAELTKRQEAGLLTWERGSGGYQQG